VCHSATGASGNHCLTAGCAHALEPHASSKPVLLAAVPDDLRSRDSIFKMSGTFPNLMQADQCH
jgi:hypothetical protein